MGIRSFSSNSSYNTAITNSLLTEEAFSYAHLVKFEKPVGTVGGKSAQRAKDYVYITDGSRDILFNDGSSSIAGVSNGIQTYVANKLVSVGAISETIEARASNINIQISGAALNISHIFRLTSTASTLQITEGTISFTDAGFREGDTVELLATGGANDTARVRIDSFSNDNFTANVTSISKVTGSSRLELSNLSSETATVYSVNFNNPEVEAFLADRTQASYARYINRDVFIYKVHIDNNGVQIGEPYLIFKGIIAGGKLSEDPAKKSVISWNLSSHWGDFQRVAGRLTSDAHHRALDSTGKPDLEAIVDPAYANDLGFQHSEQSLNIIATYQVNETRYKEKRRGGLYRLIGAKKLVEYQVEVDRETDLRFNLEAKYLPVVYGVNKIDSIPVFVDTLQTDAKTVFVAYALCEGEIGGLYDVFFDDTPSICVDENDNDTRASQTTGNTVDVLCEGRKDRGDTLTPNNIGTGSTSFATGHRYAFGAENYVINREVGHISYEYEPIISTFPGGASIQASGLTHESGRGYTTPINTRMIFHSGKKNQKADSLLLQNAANFKVGNEYFDSADSSNYWGANHRLLDTAYVVCEYEIGEGETTIPSLEFIVRGKGIPCYNYDYSYEQDPAFSGADAALSNFNIGDTVDIYHTSGGSSLGTAVLADIYELTSMDGTVITRVRFKEQPPIYPSGSFSSNANKAFYMQTGSNQFHFVTYDYVPASGSIVRTLQEDVTSASANSNGQSADITIAAADTQMTQALTSSDGITVYKTNGEKHTGVDAVSEYTYTYSGSGTTITQVGETATNTSNLTTQTVLIRDCIALGGSASSVDDKYNGYIVTVEKTFSDNSVIFETKKIIDYDGATKVAKVDSPFSKFLPSTGDQYILAVAGSVGSDNRVSINPAMQLLDYLTNDRYGRDLSLEKDIDLDSFLSAARVCDTRSEVTVVTTAQASVGDVYNHQPSSKRFWVGTVKSSTQIGNTGRYNTVFEDVSGKLVSRWENWKYFNAGELYYYDTSLYAATSGGIVSATPTTSDSNIVSSFNLFKIGTSTALAVEITPSKSSFEGNPLVKTGVESITEFSTSGYSLYDSDDVKYWRYLGWQAQNQREVTRHQTNTVINTAQPVFSNINSMLGQFNGILRYQNGKYGLDIKGSFPGVIQRTVNGVTYNIEDISEDDIIGQINVEDPGIKGTMNEVSLSIDDPQNNFESRSVTMFNSTYLKEDRMVKKKGDIRTPNVTNYYNARINAKQFLEFSRSGLKVNFTLGPKGLLLQAGDIVRINYPRFGWTNKLYRITNLSLQQDCLVAVTAEEHEDSAYLVDTISPEAVIPSEPVMANIAEPAAPTGLTATAANESRGGIVLTWTNTSNFNPATYTVQILRSATNNRSSAKIVGTSKGDNFTDTITSSGKTVVYYWIRYAVLIPLMRSSGVAPREVFSPYHPASATGGVEGISSGAMDGVEILLSPGNVSIAATSAGVPKSYAGTACTITALVGSSQLSYSSGSGTQPEDSFRVTNVTASTGITAGAASNTSNTYTQGNIQNMATATDLGSITFEIKIVDTIGNAVTVSKILPVTKLKDGLIGADGSSGFTVRGSNENHTFISDINGTASMTSFSCDFTVTKESQTFSYDGSSPYASNSFRYGSITASNVTQSIASNGTITLANNSAIASGSTDIGSLTVPIIDNRTGNTISVVVITFTKVLPPSRDGGIFTFEESNTSQISSTNAAEFAATLGNSSASAAAAAVIAVSSDGYIRPNDRVTITDNSADKAGTRVFTGTGTNSSASVSASDFGPLVVETFSGSVIVEGTLSADRLAANTTTTNTLNVGSHLILNNSGAIFTTNKTSYTDNDAGFFLGYDSNAHKLNIGNSSNYLKWTGSSIEINGNINFTNSPNISNFTNDSGFTDDTAATAAQGTANTAVTNAAAAQSTANTGVTNAAAAQSTANTGVTNAAAAQSTANTGVANAAAAQGTANTANNRAQNFDTSGDIFQGISVGTGGHIRGGQSAFNNGIGFFLGYSGSAYKFSIGNSSGGYLTWDGSSLNINGNISFANSPNISNFTNDSGFTDDTAAAAAQGTANTAVTNAAAAQSTANTGVTNAAAAQSTANTGVTNAAAAQSTANSASTAASNAQGTANTANNRAQNFDTSGDIFQGISVGTGGHIRGGQSAFNNGTGFFLGYSSNAYKFSIGNASGQRITWDGTNLSVVGSITISNASSINLGDFNNDQGFTDDTAADAAAAAASNAATAAGNAQTTANTAVTDAASASTAAASASTAAASASTAAASASTAASTAQGTANTANSRAQNFDTAGDINQGITIINGGSITVGNIVIDGNNDRILISD